MTRRAEFDIVYEDNSVLVLNKAPGIAVIPERKAIPGQSLKEKLEYRREEELLLVHRIDKDTSGLLILAKNKETQRKLSEQFEQGLIKKIYLAVVRGKPEAKDWQKIEEPIFKSSNSVKVSIHPKGKKAISLFRTIEIFKNTSLLEVEILTGRTHQIRVHLAHIDHPLLVDHLYGNKDAFYLSELKGRKIKLAKYKIEKPLIQRQSLHAYKLEFTHPTLGGKVELEAPIPKDLKALLNQLRRNA